MRIEHIIDDLLEDYDTNIKNKILNKSFTGNPAIDTNSEVGAYSSVKPSNDPFMVKKTSSVIKTPNHRDGYWEYIEHIVNSSDYKNNPFFPRVYSIKSIKDNTGKEIKRADIEKLIGYKEIDPELLVRYFSGILKTTTLDSFKNDIKIGKKLDHDQVMWAVASIIESAAYTGNFYNIRNPYLIQALQLIHKLNKTYGLDLHEENMMFRRIPTGIQLVLTDPLSGQLE